jgi:hypothetical protein
MTAELQLGGAQSVPIVEADILDGMNETDGLIAERAYEIYQSRGDEHGSDQNDLFELEQGILDPLAIHGEVADGVFRLTTQVSGFDAKDLEVVVGHRRAVVSAQTQIAQRTPMVRAERLCGLSISLLISIR